MVVKTEPGSQTCVASKSTAHMSGAFCMSEKASGLFRQAFAVCFAHFVDAPDTTLRFPHAGNCACIWASPLPIKRVPALWGPLSLANKFHTCSLRCILRQVHALTQNVLTLFFAFAKNSAKLFLYTSVSFFSGWATAKPATSLTGREKAMPLAFLAIPICL